MFGSKNKGKLILELTAENCDVIHDAVSRTLGRWVDPLEIYYLGFWVARQSAIEAMGAQSAFNTLNKIQSECLMQAITITKKIKPDWKVDTSNLNKIVDESDAKAKLYLENLKLDLSISSDQLSNVSSVFCGFVCNDLDGEKKGLVEIFLTDRLHMLMAENIVKLN